MNRALYLVPILAAVAATTTLLVPADLDLAAGSDHEVAPAAPSMEVQDTATSHHRAQAPRAAYWLAAGDALQLASRMEWKLATSSEDAAGQDVRITIAGTATVRCLAARGDALALAVAMPDPAVSLAFGNQTGDPSVLGRDLAAGFTVHLDRNGAIRGFRFPADIDARNRSMLRNWFRSTRVQVADDVEWHVPEHASGADTMIAVRRARGPGGEEVLHWERALQQAPAGFDTELQGQGRLVLDAPSGWWGEASAEECSHLVARDVGIHVRGSFRATHTLTGFTSGVGAAAFDWSEPWASADGKGEAATVTACSERAGWAEQLANASLAHEIDRLAALLAAGEGSGDGVHEQFQRIVWLLRLDGAAIDAVAARLLDPDLEPTLAEALAGALGVEGSAKAQHALASLLQTPGLADQRRLGCLRGMFQVERPEAATLAIARGMADATDVGEDLASTGLLVVGLFAQRERTGSHGEDVLAGLLAAEPRITAGGRLQVWLEALGNSGRPEVLPIAERHLRDADPSVRAAAVSSLRRVASAAAIAVLSDRVVADEDPVVRMRAVDALVDKPGPATLAVLQRALADGDEHVRTAAVQGLGSRGEVAVWRPWLEQQSRVDPSPRVRATALAILRDTAPRR